MSRPSALAVLRLTISSTLVVCWTGRSAGFSPLRTRPGICASLSIRAQGAARVAHQTASCREGACLGDREHPVAKRQRGEMFRDM